MVDGNTKLERTGDRTTILSEITGKVTVIKPAARPTVTTKEVLAKLKGAFSLGHSDEEACLIAQIDPTTLYKYCGKNESFASKKRAFEG